LRLSLPVLEGGKGECSQKRHGAAADRALGRTAAAAQDRTGQGAQTAELALAHPGDAAVLAKHLAKPA